MKMRNLRKRTLSLLLAFIMAFSMLPATALAVDTAEPIQTEEAWEQSYYVPDALEGDGWRFHSALTMTGCDLAYARYEKSVWNETTSGYSFEYAYVIALDETEGEGGNYAIPDYAAGGAPWSGDNTMSAVYIQEGVTAIGDYAFTNKNLLETVEIPDTVTRIGERAFSGDIELRASADGKTPLDLSNVTEFGAYAFYDCNALGGSGGVTLNTTSTEFTEIPDGLFTATYLTTIELNDDITSIGKSAFAHCSLSKMTTIDLPESLVTIGDYAFNRQTDSPQATITSLTIPENVTTIGQYAFYNFQALQTVTVEAKSLQKPGEAAFGDSENNAYSRPGQIQVGGQTYQGTIGTTFLMPDDADEDYIKMFDNGFNCYLGDRSPMSRYPDGDVEATCLETGRLAYVFEFLRHEDYYYQDTPALGHDWGETKTYDATCETNKYTYHYCTRENCAFHTSAQTVETFPNTATGHNYQYSYTQNPAIQSDQTTTIYYVCLSGAHNDTYDQSKQKVGLTLTGATLQATTLMTLDDLDSALAAVGTNSSNVGKLEWNEESTDTLLSAGEQDVKVKFTPTNNQTFPGSVTNSVSDGTGGTDLTIKVNVSKVTLDFSNMSMSPLTQYVGGNFANVTASNMPDVTQGNIEYWNGTGWSQTAPALTEDNAAKDYKVRILFTYDGEYVLPETGDDELPPTGYTLVQKDGQTWVETAFHINMREIAGTVSAIPNLTYNKTQQDTVSVTGIPVGSTVKFFVSDGSNGWTQVGKDIVTTSADQRVTGAPMTDAGDQVVKVEITKNNYVSQTVTVTGVIGKQQVETPKAVTTQMSFTPISATTAQEFTGVPDSTDTQLYTVSGNKSSQAGTHTAKAVLTDKDNYEWTTGDENKDGTAEISWTILRRTIQKPNFNNNATFSFNNTAHTAVTAPSAGDYVAQYDESGTLSVCYAPNEESTGYVAYTATNARQTNAGTYTVTVDLKDPQNYRWSDDLDSDYTAGTWTISAKVINAPSVSADTITYDGQPYDGTITLTHSTGENSSNGILKLGTNHTYTDKGAETKTPPTNAGSYTVKPELVFEAGLIATNYTVLNPGTASFQIQKATLMLQSPGNQSLTYTGSAQQVTGVTVDSTGLVEGDNESAYTVSYTYSYKNDQGETVTTESSNTPPSLKDLGTYTVTASLTADNYQATPVSYTVTIGTGTQTITLAPAEADKAGWNDEDSDGTYTMTVTLGVTESFTVTGKGAVDPDATITYAVTAENDGDANTSEDNVIDISSETSGLVTVKGAGTATVTVKAAETSKVGEASVAYNVTVNKGTPVINRADISVTYDGQPLAESDYKATLSAPAGSGAPTPTGELQYQFYDTEEHASAGGDEGKTDAPSAQGTYYLRISYGGDNNYNLAYKTVKVEIAAAALTITANDVDKTYDGDTVSLDSRLTVKDAARNTLNASEYTVVFVRSTTQPTDWSSGTATIVCNVADSGTYWFKVSAANHSDYIGSLEVDIAPIALTLTPTVTTEKVYDGKTDAEITAINSTDYDGPAISLAGTASGETINVTAAAAYNDKTAADGKTITVTYTLTGANLANYTFNGKEAKDGKVSADLADKGKITPKEITVTDGISATDKVYDGNNIITLTGKPTVAEGAFVIGDNVSFSAIDGKTGTVESADVGTGKPVTVAAATLNDLLTGADAGNYTVSADYKGATVDITPRPVYLLFPNQTQGTEWSIDVPYSTGGLTSQHGVYQVSAKEADNVSGFVGTDGVSLADSDIVYTFTDSKGTEINAPKDLGTYTVTAKLSDTVGDKFANYAINEISGTIEIIKNDEALSVNITGKTGLTYNGEGQDPIQSIAVQGGSETLTEDTGYTIGYSLTAGDTNYDLDRTKLTAAIKDAGSYTVYWKVTTTNYGEKTGNFTVTVAKATLTLSRDVEVTRAYNGATGASTQITGATLTGQQNSENISVTGTSAAYDAATVDASKITITYTLTAADGVLDNYKVSINNAAAVDAAASMTEDVTATITKAPVTVTISNQTAVYDGAKPEVAQEQGSADEPKNWYVSNGQVYQLSSGKDDDLGITLSISSDAKNVNTYAITGTATNKNYNVTFVNGEFEVTPRNVQVTIGDKSGVYGDVPNVTADAGNVTLTDKSTDEGEGIVDGENIYSVLTGLGLTTTATKESPITDGTHSYSISAESGDKVYGNYDVTFTEGKYTVNKRPITITIADKSSDYGCATAQLDYEVTYTGNSGETAIVNSDDLKIQLSTTATKAANAGDYPITGTTAGGADVVGNYDITWKGSWSQEDDNQGKAGTYTIDKADLTIAFPNQSVNVSMGNSVNNPLEFTNASNNNEKLTDKPEDVTVEYMSDKPDVAKVNKETGAVTIVGPGDATITATVTGGGRNFNGDATAKYEIHVAGASTGIQVQTTPDSSLVYNGAMQQLLSGYTVTPSNATVTFEVTANAEGDSCKIDETTKMPMAKDAGTYRVSWTAKLDGYSDVTGWVDVTIDKDNPSSGFSSAKVQTTYEEGKVFNSTTSTTLNKASGYTGNITYQSNNTQVAKVNDNNLATISINATGNATISARFTETDNYKAQTVSFALEVVDSKTAIQYSAASSYEVKYDGKPHGAKITVSSPTTYTIKYSSNGGISYDLDESPTITDVDKSPLTIHYQISAPGYTPVTSTQTVTVKPKTIGDDMVSGVAASYTYTGAQITVDNTLTVADGSTLLVKDKDYKVEYGANTEVGAQSGSVKITGMGNYDGSITKYFNISAVDASYLTASLDRYYGTYGDSETNNANVTVKFGDNELTVGQDYQIACDTAATIVDNKLTFTTVGTHTITVTGTGNYDGEVTLTYTLLPAASEHGLNLTAGGQATPNITTYGETVDGSIVVADPSDHSKVLDPRHYDLTYVYYDNLGSQPTSSATYTEDILEKGTPQAGMYVVTATAKGSYSGTGSFVFLILKRDLADTDISAQIDGNPVYSGQAQQPTVSLSYNGDAITDLAATQYLNNVNAGQAQAVSTADGTNNNFTGTRVDKFTIDKKSIATGFDAKADPKAYDYTGKVIVPTVTVTDTVTSATLNRNTDFTVTASGQEPGNYQATVKGIGNYTGELPVDYTILSNPIQPVTGLELTVTPDKWTYTATPSVTIDVTHDGNSITDYTLTVEKDGTAVVTNDDAEAAVAALVEPGTYTITANGTGAYTGSSDQATVTISKIKPEVTVTATPTSLSSSGKITLTVSGSNLPADTDLTSLLKVTAANGTAVDLTKLNWTENTDGSDTAELTLTNANETYTFTLAFTGNDFYDAASDTAMVVTAQHTSSGGGGGGGGGTTTPPAEETDSDISTPNDTGVSEWLITSEHIQYLSGYGDGLFGPTDNMTRAQTAQMFYNLLKDKDVPVTVTFDDVPADAWYAESVGTLASLGIINGVADGYYAPDRAITRAEFTAIAMRFAQVDTSGADIFPDVNEDDWFYEMVVSAVNYGWVNGYADGTFRPNATITRAEVAAIVNRMLSRSADEAYVDAHSDELTQFTDVSPYYWAYYNIMEAANPHEYTQKDGTEVWKD